MGLDPDFWVGGSRWFGMTMYPGYGWGPYHSPIHLEGFLLTGDETFCLDFLNLAYAHGVQDFSVDFEVLRGTETYQICANEKQPDRAFVFVPLDLKWLEIHFPRQANRNLFDIDGKPLEDRILAVAFN